MHIIEGVRGGGVPLLMRVNKINVQVAKKEK
jgi:hypothetical protein